MRILCTFLAFLYGCLLAIGGLIFPTTLVMMFSFLQFITWPFIWLFNQNEAKIEPEWPIVGYSNYYPINAFLGVTILFWFPFWVASVYWKEGKLI